MEELRKKIVRLLRWSERYTKTDMVYLAQGGGWLTFAHISGSVTSLLTAILFAHFFTKESYGIYKYVLSLLGIFGAFSLTGVGAALVQATARVGNGFYVHALRKNMVWALIPSCISIATGAYYLIQGNAVIGWSLVVAGVLYPPFSTFPLFSSYLIGKKDFKKSALLGLLPDVGVLLAIGITVWLTQSVVITIGIYFLASICTNYIAHRLSARAHPPADTRAEPENLLSKHLSFLNIFSTVVTHIDKVLIFQVLGPVQVAVYFFATAVPDQIRGLFKIPGSLALPKLAEAPKDIKKILRAHLPKITAAYGALVVTYIIVAPLVYKVLFPAYIEAVRYSQVIALGLIGSGVLILINQGLQAQHSVRSLYVLHGTQSAAILGATIVPLLLGGSLFTLIAARTATMLALGVFGYLLLLRPVQESSRFSSNNKIS